MTDTCSSLHRAVNFSNRLQNFSYEIVCENEDVHPLRSDLAAFVCRVITCSTLLTKCEPKCAQLTTKALFMDIVDPDACVNAVVTRSPEGFQRCVSARR